MFEICVSCYCFPISTISPIFLPTIVQIYKKIISKPKLNTMFILITVPIYGNFSEEPDEPVSSEEIPEPTFDTLPDLQINNGQEPREDPFQRDEVKYFNKFCILNVIFNYVNEMKS